MQIKLTCPKCNGPLEANHINYFCENSHTYMVINEIPRFVVGSNYAKSFGIQWNKFPKTQLDSFTKTKYSYERLQRIVGDVSVFNGKQVLEVGCGAGRFSELILNLGANLFAMDLSNAVEANLLNNLNSKKYFVCQGDILQPPIFPGQFEIVVCLGVVQHTPNPQNTINALFQQLAPDGTLFIDSYSMEYPFTLSRKLARYFLLKMPEVNRFPLVKFIVTLGWPIHRLLWRTASITFLQKKRYIQRIRYLFLRISPIIDYHDAYPQLGVKLLKEWAILDTHDNLTDRYKHLISMSQFESLLAESGFIDIVIKIGGNGLEASAKKQK